MMFDSKLCENKSRPLNFRRIGIFFIFHFLITYGVCKKRKCCNRMRENKTKKCLLLTNVHVLYVLEDKTNKQKFPSVCTWT